MRPIKRYELIELIIPGGATQTKFPFPDIPQLRSDVTQDIVIRGLETYSAESVPADFNAVPLATLAQLQKCFLTLYIQQEQSVNNVPLVKLINVNELTAGYFFTNELNQFEDLMIDWTKSFLTLSSVMGNAGNIAVILGAMYKRYNAGTVAALQAKEDLQNKTVFDWYNAQGPGAAISGRR